MSFQRPHIFDYLNYRDFVRDFVAYLKSKGEYKVRDFAVAVGFGSYTYVSMVIAGKRNLTDTTALRLAKGFQLSSDEKNYFLRLVTFTKSKKDEKKEEALEDLVDLQKAKKKKAEILQHYKSLSDWWMYALLEGVNSIWQSASIDQMAEDLGLETSVVRSSLHTLENLGLIKQSGKYWRRLEANLETPDEILGLGMRQYYRQIIGKSIEAIDTAPREHREYGGLTLSLTPESLKKLKDRLVKFQQETASIFENESSNASLYQVNFQLFPLIQSKKSK